MTKLALALVALLAALLPAPRAAAEAAPPGMKAYRMVIFHKGANTNLAPAEIPKMQQGHLAGLKRLNLDRVNLLYGPFLDEHDIRGIAVLDVADAAAARKAFAQDPFVKQGAMTIEVRPWLAETNAFALPDATETPGQFVMVFLVKGPNRQQSEAETQTIQAAHLAFLKLKHAEGKLAVAGPFLDDADSRGVAIYRVASKAEAEAIAAEDPAVKAGRLKVEARPWMTFKGMLKSGSAN